MVTGTANAKLRFQIYVFMLQNMDDESRFQLTFRLSRDVLLGFVEGSLPLKNSCTDAVLKDTLAVLASDDIKLASLTASCGDDDPIEKEDIQQAIVQTTKKAIIAHVVKRNVIENIVPIVVEMKRKLASLQSPLMGDLMRFLRELVKDYKDEIQQVLGADRQLMAEIDFDLKRFEQQQQQQPQNDGQNAAVRDRTLSERNSSRKSARSIAPNVPMEEPPLADRLEEQHQYPIATPVVGEESANNPPRNDEANAQPEAVIEDMETDLPVAVDGQQQPSFVRPTTPTSNLPLNNRATRLRNNLRNISTPVRDMAVRDATFNIGEDADLSAIALPQPTVRRKRKHRTGMQLS